VFVFLAAVSSNHATTMQLAAASQFCIVVQCVALIVVSLESLRVAYLH